MAFALGLFIAFKSLRMKSVIRFILSLTFVFTHFTWADTHPLIIDWKGNKAEIDRNMIKRELASFSVPAKERIMQRISIAESEEGDLGVMRSLCSIVVDCMDNNQPELAGVALDKLMQNMEKFDDPLS